MASMTRSLLARGYATAAAVKVCPNPRPTLPENLTPLLPLWNAQPPVQLTSLSGTYATSTYLAAAKKSSKELDGVAKDLQALEKKLKEDAKTADFLSESRSRDRGIRQAENLGRRLGGEEKKEIGVIRRKTGRQMRCGVRNIRTDWLQRSSLGSTITRFSRCFERSRAMSMPGMAIFIEPVNVPEASRTSERLSDLDQHRDVESARSFASLYRTCTMPTLRPN